MLGPYEGLTLLDIGMLAGQSLGHKLLADLCLGLFDSLFPLVTKCCAGAIYFALVMVLTLPGLRTEFYVRGHFGERRLHTACSQGPPSRGSSPQAVHVLGTIPPEYPGRLKGLGVPVP